MKSPRPEITMPGMSMPPSDRAFLICAGMTMLQTTTAKIPTGMLTKKIHDQ